MRNLKKILSLVLALMMVVSVMATASATSFVDDEDITYKEAVEVMAGLGILNGVPNADGSFSFEPNNGLKRDAAAKMVAYILNGGHVTAADVDGMVNPFKDVSGWAEDVIVYCYNMGIVNGVNEANDEFSPSTALTGYAFAKMLLAAIGVDGEYTGGNWTLAVGTNAKAAGLLNGMPASFLLSKNITREEASQMAWNALNYGNKVVGYTLSADPAGTVYPTFLEAAVVKSAASLGGTIDPYYSGSLATENFGLQSVMGVVVANQATGSTTTKIDTATVNANGKITALAGAPINYNITTDLDMIGHVVTVYYKSTGAKGLTYAVVDHSDVVTVARNISTAAGMAAAFGAGTDDAAAVYNFADYVGTQGAAIAGFTKDAAATKGTYVLFGGEIVSFVTVSTGIGVVSKVTAYTAPTAAANGSVTLVGVDADGNYGTTAAITLNKIGSTTPDNVKLYDGIVAGDYVYVTKVGTGVPVVEKAKVVTTTIDGRTSDDSSVVINNASVDVAVPSAYVVANDCTLTQLGLTAVGSATLGTVPYNVVMTSTGDVLGYYAYTPASEANNYAVVQAVSVTGASGSATWAGGNFVPASAKIKLALADGTTAIYSFQLTAAQSQMNSGALTTALGLTGITAGDVIKYAANEGVITEIVAATTVSGTAVKQGSTLITGVANKYLTANSVLLYWNTADTTDWAVTRFEGYNALKTATASVEAVVDANGYVVFAYVNAAGATSVSNTLKAFFPSEAYTVRYDATLRATVYDYTAYVDGVKTTLTATGEITSTGTAGAVKIAEYTMTDGYLTAINYISAGSAANEYVDADITYVTDDVLVAGGTEYTYANAKVYVVALDGTVTEGSVNVSSAAYNTVLVVKTAATGSAVADLAYIYYYVLP